jgi:hypothetical protein
MKRKNSNKFRTIVAALNSETHIRKCKRIQNGKKANGKANA